MIRTRAVDEFRKAWSFRRSIQPDAAPSSLPLVMPTRRRAGAPCCGMTGSPRDRYSAGLRRCHAAAETSGHGRARCGGNVGARQNTLRRKRRRTAEHAVAETSAHGRTRCGGNVGARQTTLRRKRRRTAEHAAAETSAHGRTRCGGNVGARHAVPRRRAVIAFDTCRQLSHLCS